LNISELKNCAIFSGMTECEVRSALKALNTHEREYKKGETILHAGDCTRELGIILSGSITIENDDLWGNRSILNLSEAGDLFAEVYAILGNEPLLVNARANTDCRILFMQTAMLRAMHPESLQPKLQEEPKEEQSAGWNSKLISNLLLIASRKNLALSGRAFHTSPKTIRGRLMAYLDTMSLRKHSREFDIPFDRQQLADYLNVERTALSKELGKMKSDGLIEFRRSHFKIL